MVMTIVVIVVAATLTMTMVHLALMQRRQFETDRRRVQAECYAQAGLDRAAAALTKSAEYDGETWSVTESAGSSERTASVVIEIQRDGERPRIAVAVEYPAGDLHRVRVRRQLPFVTPQGATAVSALQPENRLP